MKSRLFKLMGIEPGEESMISLLLTQSVFLGIFLGAFDISAHSFFLSIFDEKMMARGYVLSGMAGIILTSLYTWMQTKIKFSKFSTVNLAFISTITLILWILLLTNPDKWVIWLVFIMMGPLNILAILGFWGTVSRLFTLRQGKRLFGLIDAGLIIGIILSSYAIPLLLTMNFKAHNILLISAGAVFTGSIIQMVIGSRFKISHGNVGIETEAGKEKQSFIAVFRKDPYIRTMALFIALSVMTAFFVQYSFMAVTRVQYPSANDMARFLGLFTGSMMIFTLLIKLFIFSYLIRNYGLRTCLSLSPILIALFTVIAVALGLVKGYTPAAGLGFILFFMVLALNRLFSKSLKDSIESPSFKVIYQALDENIRYEVQSSVDGTVNEIAALFSGLILAGLGILSFIKLIHFSIVLIFITALWIFVAFKLYAGYRNTIRKALETSGENKMGLKTKSEVSGFNNRFSATLAFKNDYFTLVAGKYDCLKNNSSHYYNALINTADSEKDINLVPALKKIASDTSLEEGIRHRSEKTAESLELLSATFIHKDDKLFEARTTLADSRVPQTTQLLRLLRDNSPASKRLAIFMIGKFRMKDMLPEVSECLNIPFLESQAVNVLRSFGSEGDEEMRRFYLLSSGNVQISKTILRLLAGSNTDENKEFLLARLWSTSRQIREIALEKLIECQFTPTAEEKDRLHQMISDIIGIMVWNLSARICLKRHNNNFLLEALGKEISRWNRFFFNLLSITYDPSYIRRIKENLESGTIESVNYALEMIDMVIDEAIKPKIITLLDVIPDEEKVRQLFQFYPGVIPEYERLLEDLLNRDYNLLGIWIRACALRNMNEIGTESIIESVTALLFSPEIILQEESAGLLSRAGNNLYNNASSRIPQDARGRIDRIAGGDAVKEALVYEKVKFLSSCFTGMEEEDLLSLAYSLSFTEKSMKRTLPGKGGYILWQSTSGDVRIFYEPDIISELTYVLPFAVIEEYCTHFPENSGKILEYIERNLS